MSICAELQTMLRAARLYYEDGLTQQQVADELGVSRPKVSRLLTRARAEGIVRITIVDPFATFGEVEQHLVETFGLREAVVIAGEGLSEEALRRRLGLAAASYLRRTLRDGLRVGVGWGRTLRATVEALNNERQVAIHAVPLIGGIGQVSPSFQVNDLARRMAEAFGGTWQALYAPAFVGDTQARDALLNHPDVKLVMEGWETLDVALVGIGHFAFQRQSSMFFAEYMAQTLLQELEERGAMGDLCGRFFDIYGRQCILEAGVIGISLDQLKALDHVIGVAGGKEKMTAILGALRGGYLNVLITDTVTAQAVLEHHENET
ncbi:MAG TPA: sugar-binding transcriptional regulator [Thermoflexia bacterium]|nr:sugar-binding transcriptional regulator [Thermoflexia bacterium]